MRKYDFNLKEFLYLTRFASKEPTRYYISGVWFAVNGDMVATDGHRIGLFQNGFVEHIEGESGKEGFLIRWDKNALSILKKSKSEEASFEIEMGAESALIKTGDMIQALVYIDRCAYPDYKRVIPTGENKGCPALCLNPDYVSDFQFEKNTGVVFEFPNDNDNAPVRVKLTSKPDFVGALMPMRR